MSLSRRFYWAPNCATSRAVARDTVVVTMTNVPPISATRSGTHTFESMHGHCRLAAATLEIAVRDGLLATNPVAKVRRPKVTRSEARHLSTAEVKSLLSHAKGSRYYPAVFLMAFTGLRRGEVAGLAWSDVDLAKAEMTVKHTLGRVGGELVLSEPKTTRSRRRVPLAAPLVAELKAHKIRQDAERKTAANV